jgi:hypothetical protein
MNEIKCPECGKVFSVDEASYASIVNQVRTKELEEEIQRRTAEIEKLQQLKQQSDKLVAEQGFQQKLQAKERELEKRNAEIARLEEQVNSIAISKDSLNASRSTDGQFKAPSILQRNGIIQKDVNSLFNSYNINIQQNNSNYASILKL